MFRIQSIVAGVRALFRKRQVEQEMDEELRGYLDAAVKEKMRSGMSQEQALRAARVEMGSLDAVKEQIRSAGWESTVETIWQDLRFGLRVLRKNAGFTAVAALTLALGIGGTAVVFSLLDAVLLRPLPYPNSERLLRLFPLEGQSKRGVSQASYPDFCDWQRQTRTFESLAAYDGTSLNLTGTGEPERLEGSAITLIPRIEKEIWRVNPDQPITEIKTMDEWVAREAAGRRFILVLIGAFASIAAVLAAIGIYGVAAYGMRQRTHEIGIRMALGARGQQVVWLILRQNVLWLLTGTAAGLAGALALTRLLERYLYAVRPTDASTFALIVLLELAIAAAASFIPARRATKVDPMVALRYE